MQWIGAVCEHSHTRPHTSAHCFLQQLSSANCGSTTLFFPRASLQILHAAIHFEPFISICHLSNTHTLPCIDTHTQSNRQLSVNWTSPVWRNSKHKSPPNSDKSLNNCKRNKSIPQNECLNFVNNKVFI